MNQSLPQLYIDPNVFYKAQQEIVTDTHGKGYAQNRRWTSGELLAMLKHMAEFHTAKETCIWVKEHFKKEISIPALSAMRTSPRWGSIYSELRQSYLQAVKDIPMSHPEIRMARYEDLYCKAEEKQDNKLCLNILMVVDRHVETTTAPPMQQNYYLTQINNMTDDELFKRKQELLEKLKLQKTRIMPVYKPIIEEVKDNALHEGEGKEIEKTEKIGESTYAEQI